MAYWLLRSEPDAYSWDDLVRDAGTEWNGVRNYTARNFLKTMEPGDLALFYHSNTEKAAVGIMKITRAWQPDGDDGKWASVAVEAGRKAGQARHARGDQGRAAPKGARNAPSVAPVGYPGARRRMGRAAGNGRGIICPSPDRGGNRAPQLRRRPVRRISCPAP
jgi:hypothetical protein